MAWEIGFIGQKLFRIIRCSAEILKLLILLKLRPFERHSDVNMKRLVQIVVNNAIDFRNPKERQVLTEFIDDISAIPHCIGKETLQFFYTEMQRSVVITIVIKRSVITIFLIDSVLRIIIRRIMFARRGILKSNRIFSAIEVFCPC